MRIPKKTKILPQKTYKLKKKLKQANKVGETKI